MFEKLVNSRINEVADWIIRLIVLNVMIVFFSLAIVTIYPAFSAGYNMFNDYVSKKNPRLFKDYYRYFKEALGKKILLGLIIVVVFLLGYMNIRYYNLYLADNSTLFYTIGYYISLGLLAIWFAMTMYSIIVVRVTTKIKLLYLFKLSFFLAGKYYFRTLLIVSITIAPFFLLLTPITTMVFIFMGLSIPLLLNVLLTRRAVEYLEKLGERNG